MTLTLSLPTETETKLRERAAAARTDVAAFVVEAIEQKLAAPLTDHDRTAPMPLDEFDRWLDELSAGSERLPSLPTDFSRADIYQDHD